MPVAFKACFSQPPLLLPLLQLLHVRYISLIVLLAVLLL
jgi:hypothetical protein